jgi:hypothetical protein
VGVERSHSSRRKSLRNSPEESYCGQHREEEKEVHMLIRMGKFFEVEISGGGVFLKAPALGEVWLGFDGERHWDRR